MLHVQLVAIPLGLELASYPFARIDPIADLGGLVVAVGNGNNLIGIEVSLLISRAGILDRQRPSLIRRQPCSYRFLVRHVVVLDTCCPQAHAIGYALTYLVELALLCGVERHQVASLIIVVRLGMLGFAYMSSSCSFMSA